ncbi:hemoglobin subunit zeta-like [Watersipora subatra]|uniref:hemoglobin subunit zeta-like n=1 Tax=Watersipora subatra TaxID=2589382 RepID=UPI00355BFA3C
MGNTADGKPAKPPVSLTKKQKTLITKNWYKHIHKDEFIGAKFFDQMFSESPESKDAFGIFAEINVKDDHYNEVLHRHGSRVKGAVGKVVEAISSHKDYSLYIHKLGCRHYKEYKFDPQYIQVLLSYFLIAIKEAMADDWSDEIKQAFTILFEIVSFYMLNSVSH